MLINNLGFKILIINSGIKHKVGKKMGNTHISQAVGNTGYSRELLVIPGNYWEIGPSSMRKF